jgi:hypothetical protein
MTASVFSAIPFLLGVVCLFFYQIDTGTNIRMTNELAERRRRFAAQQAASPGA